MYAVVPRVEGSLTPSAGIKWRPSRTWSGCCRRRRAAEQWSFSPTPPPLAVGRAPSPLATGVDCCTWPKSDHRPFRPLFLSLASCSVISSSESPLSPVFSPILSPAPSTAVLSPVPSVAVFFPFPPVCGRLVYTLSPPLSSVPLSLAACYLMTRLPAARDPAGVRSTQGEATRERRPGRGDQGEVTRER